MTDAAGTEQAGRDELRRLIAAASAGDERAWNEIVMRYERAAWAWTRSASLTEDDRADIVWSAFTTLWRRLRSSALAEPEHIGGYLRRIVRNEIADLLGRRTVATGDARRVARELLFAPEDRPVGAAVTVDADPDELAPFVRGAVQLLPPGCRDLLVAWMDSIGERDQYTTVAARLGRPVGSIGPTFGRCCAKLRVLLAEMGFDPDLWLAGGEG